MFLTRKRLRLYLGALLVLQVATCLGFISSIRGGYVDLRTFYTAGYLVRTGNAALIYDYRTEQEAQSRLATHDAKSTLVMFAPPYTALFFVPLSLATFRTAYFLFFATNLLLLALAIVAMHPQLQSLSERWKPLPALLFLSFLPIGFALMMGQITIILLFIYCLCSIALQNEKPLAAGMFLSLALMKFQVALPIAFLFLAWRCWLFSAGFLGGTAVLTAVSAAIIGVKNLIPYLRSLFLSASAASGNPYSQINAQTKYAIFPQHMPNLYGLILSLSGGAHWAMALTVIASILIVAWAMFQPPSLPLALLVGLLVSYHLYASDLALLVLPLSLLADQALRRNDRLPEMAHSTGNKRAEWRRAAALCSAAFLLIGPIEIFVISSGATYLLAIPIATLLLSQTEWTPLSSQSALPRPAQG